MEDSDIIPFSDFISAYLDCRKSKRNKDSALLFELEWEKNLYKLYIEVNNRTYEISKSTAFVITKPKKREVFAADFRDRIIHHLVCSRLEPLFENYFIEDTYNCRKKKGTEYGVQRLYENIKRVSNNYTRECYIAKFDMLGFFMSIHKPTLWEKLKIFIEKNYHLNDKDLILWLTKKIVLASPEENCIIKMPIRMWRGIPSNKSLFTNGKDYGLPIGNLTSQMFANFYLTEFDKIMSKKFVYGRYVDDFYIINIDKNKILKEINNIKLELSKIQITLHPNKIYILKYHRGVQFIGGIIKSNRIYNSNRTIFNFRLTIYDINLIASRRLNINKVLSQINSYLGFLRHRLEYRLKNSILLLLNIKWYKYFYISNQCLKLSLRNRYKSKTIICAKIKKLKHSIHKLKVYNFNT